MKKECVFRCQFGGRCYSIHATQNPKNEGALIYWTYIGRRKLDAFSWTSFEGALGSIMTGCPDFDISYFRRVWG